MELKMNKFDFFATQLNKLERIVSVF